MNLENPKPDAQAPEEGAPRPVRRQKMFTGRDLRASTIGWEIAIPLFSGPLIGFILDRQYDTGVRWTLILMITGLLLAVIAVVKYLRYEMYLMRKELEEKEKADAKREL